ncbi:hypothetical protein STEG23_001272, partial [Scotinomys teguina]
MTSSSLKSPTEMPHCRKCEQQDSATFKMLHHKKVNVSCDIYGVKVDVARWFVMTDLLLQAHELSLGCGCPVSYIDTYVDREVFVFVYLLKHCGIRVHELSKGILIESSITYSPAQLSVTLQTPVSCFIPRNTLPLLDRNSPLSVQYGDSAEDFERHFKCRNLNIDSLVRISHLLRNTTNKAHDYHPLPISAISEKNHTAVTSVCSDDWLIVRMKRKPFDNDTEVRVDDIHLGDNCSVTRLLGFNYEFSYPVVSCGINKFVFQGKVFIFSEIRYRLELELTYRFQVVCSVKRPTLSPVESFGFSGYNVSSFRGGTQVIRQHSSVSRKSKLCEPLLAVLVSDSELEVCPNEGLYGFGGLSSPSCLGLALCWEHRRKSVWLTPVSTDEDQKMTNLEGNPTHGFGFKQMAPLLKFDANFFPSVMFHPHLRQLIEMGRALRARAYEHRGGAPDIELLEESPPTKVLPEKPAAPPPPQTWQTILKRDLEFLGFVLSGFLSIMSERKNTLYLVTDDRLYEELNVYSPIYMYALTQSLFSGVYQSKVFSFPL